jgi:hypothetical protein
MANLTVTVTVTPKEFTQVIDVEYEDDFTPDEIDEAIDSALDIYFNDECLVDAFLDYSDITIDY